jgi:selenoprotein W-related protein
LASTLLTQFKQQLASLELEPSSGGCFEITVDGDLVYSKLAKGSFPDEATIVAAVKQRMR